MFSRALLAVGLTLALSGCPLALTSEEKAQIAALKLDQAGVRSELEAARLEDAKYSGGLIKSLIAIRLEVLKTNEALIQQRISMIEGRLSPEIIVKSTSSDAKRADEIAQELANQHAKLNDSIANSNRYTGGLIKALSDSASATISNTIAMLDQQRLIAKYGLVLPNAPPTPFSSSATAAQPAALPIQTSTTQGNNCLKILVFDSSILKTNDAYTEIAWKVDVSNSCEQIFNVRVTYKFVDKDDFELDADSESIRIEANSTGKARGRSLVASEKARRIATNSVRIAFQQ